LVHFQPDLRGKVRHTSCPRNPDARHGTYGYDGFDRNTGYTPAPPTVPPGIECQGKSAASFAYDGLDRQRRGTGPTGAAVTLHHDGLSDQVVARRTEGALTVEYLRDPRGRPKAVAASDGVVELLADDGTDNITTVTRNDAAGMPSCTARFDPFGQPVDAQLDVTQNVCNTGTRHGSGSDRWQSSRGSSSWPPS